jgi:hypothetical protein
MDENITHLAAIKKFQEFFGSHFPELANDDDRAGFEMGWLASTIWGNPSFPVVRRSEALKHLDFFKQQFAGSAPLNLAASIVRMPSAALTRRRPHAQIFFSRMKISAGIVE